MIEGLRMRLLVIVWNTTVETATATATCTIPTSCVSRRFRTKPILPRKPVNRNVQARIAARDQIITSRQGIRRGAVRRMAPASSATAWPQMQNGQKSQRADDAEHRA